MSDYRSLRLRVAAKGKIGELTFLGRSHFVVPVVALVEGVVWPANVDWPEFVPAEVLADFPEGWNGLPVTQSHPQLMGDFTSATIPEAYEKFAYGIIFNSQFENSALEMEAWLDTARIKPGSVAERSLEALQDGRMVEVSVGAFIERLKEEGTFNGKEYTSRWLKMFPNHLAILSEGEIGACSISMGCGALRVAKAHHITADGQIEVEPATVKLEIDGKAIAEAVASELPTEVQMAVASANITKCSKHPEEEVKPDALCAKCAAGSTTPKKKTWKERFSEFLSQFTPNQSAEDMTDMDLRNSLDAALRANEPGYLGIDAVQPEAKQVVYAVYPEDRVILYRRSYSLSDSGEVSFGDDREEVKMVSRYEPVSAAAAAPTGAAECGCKNKKAAAGQTHSQENVNMDREAKIKSLIDSGKFSENDRAYLGSAPDNILEALSVSAEKPAGAIAGASEKTADQYLNEAPEAIREELKAAHLSMQAKRTQTIAALKASGRCVFTDEELATKNMQELDKLAALAQVPTVADFSARGVALSTSSDAGVPEPPSLVSAVQAARKK